MSFLLSLSRIIDAINERVGRLSMWLILLSILISTGNALARKFFDLSSNGMLEIQWYLFAAVFLLCAGYALKHDEHVRIDVLVGHLSRKVHAWIDIFGTLFFLLPLASMMVYLSWGVFVEAWNSGEVSSNAGGLIIWPARLLVPIGFGLLCLQGVSELLKRVAFLAGAAPYPNPKGHKSAEEELAEEIRRRGCREVTDND